VTSEDPGFAPGRWSPVFALLRAMDDEIAAVYEGWGLPELRPRFAPAVLELRAHGPRTIRALAEAVGVTHSAMSQTVTAMRSAGLVESVPGPDARTRVVRLTDHGGRVSALVRAEWDATEAAIGALEDEVDHPLTRAAADVAEALGRRPFRDRIAEHLDAAGHLAAADRPGAVAGRAPTDPPA
jgi:DNA-binding MarR family transcriptional regulator